MNRQCWKPDGFNMEAIPVHHSLILQVIGTTGGGVAGVSYPDVRTGIRAQVQHLKAYACDGSAQSGLCRYKI